MQQSIRIAYKDMCLCFLFEYLSHVQNLSSCLKTFVLCVLSQIACSSGNANKPPHYSGTQIPDLLRLSSCNQVNVYFHTDSSVISTGFNLTYTIISGKLYLISVCENS